MIKNIFIWCVIVVLTCNSCKSQQNNNDTSKTVKETKQLTNFYLGVDDLTLTNLSNDSTEMHIELGKPSGDYTMFYFKVVPKNRMDTVGTVKGLFVELKRSENKNIPIEDPNALKPLNYHGYAFEINKKDWEELKILAKEIVATSDTIYKDYYCEFCSSYLLAYNNKVVQNKLTKDNKIEKLFNVLIEKYKAWLYASKK